MWQQLNTRIQELWVSGLQKAFQSPPALWMWCHAVAHRGSPQGASRGSRSPLPPAPWSRITALCIAAAIEVTAPLPSVPLRAVLWPQGKTIQLTNWQKSWSINEFLGGKQGRQNYILGICVALTCNGAADLLCSIKVMGWKVRLGRSKWLLLLETACTSTWSCISGVFCTLPSCHYHSQPVHPKGL